MKNMKMVKKLMTIVTVAALFLSSLTGCGTYAEASAEKPVLAVSLVIGNHMCSKGLNLNSPLIRDNVSETIANYGFVSVVSDDGIPSLILAESFDIPDQYKNASENKLRADADNKTSNLMMQLTKVTADDDEVDTLESIRIAVRSLASAPMDARKTIIVVDTGLSTTGLLNFRNNLIGADADLIANTLAEKKAIPDLSNITVMWQQLGDVASPQQELSPGQVKDLEEIWRAIVEKGGGTFICSATVPNNNTVIGDLPTVSMVNLIAEEPVRFDASMTEITKDVFTGPLIFTEEQIRFNGDSADYYDEEAANNALSPIVDYMMSDPGFQVVLCGTTAGDRDSDYVRELSYARAERVRQSLIDMGIDASRIVAVGLSNQDPWHIYGVGTDTELAGHNRKVVLLNADSEDARSILSAE